jgi:glyoxylase I family protein
VSDGTDRPSAVHHVALQVRDLAAMEAFYRDLIGLPVQRRWPAADGSGDRSVWLDLGAGAFLALERADGPTVGSDWQRPDLGWHLVALRISRDARARWETRLTAAGVAIAHRTPYTLYVRDPEGNRVGLSHWPDEAT